MPTSHFLLTDVDAGISLEDFAINAESRLSRARASDWSVTKKTLHGGVSEGVEVVTINHGDLSIDVLPTRGMGIWKATLGDLTIGWDSPVARPVHPAFVPIDAPHGLGWLRGFNELIARCGLASNGAPGHDPGGNPLENPLTLHGRIGNLPAHRLELEIDDDGPGTIRLTGIVDESSLFGTNLRLTSTLTTEVGSHDFEIRDVITNRGATPAEAQMLYHINLGPPFLEDGSRLSAPATEIAPRDARAAEGIAHWSNYGRPTAGFAEQVYFIDPIANEDHKSFAVLRNAAGDRGVSVHFDRRELPCLSIWKNTGAVADGYVTGIEPGTNYPNNRSFERTQGRVLSLAPGQSREMTVRFAIHDDLENVAAIESLAEKLSEARECQIHEAPREGWSLKPFP